MQKQVIALMLANKRKNELRPLTQNISKSLMPYGGKYRIIDFPLSNCMHSGIDTVGVITQYPYWELMAHIGKGEAWDMYHKSGGITILKGAGPGYDIRHTVRYIEQFCPQYVLILSGDNIYKMDYTPMLHLHRQKNADVTLSAVQVPWDIASQFRIVYADSESNLYKIELNPKFSENNLASMGVYIFKWDILKTYLLEQPKGLFSPYCIEQNILYPMLHNGQKACVYRFKGYWADITSIQSFWKANMDLLKREWALDMHDKDWRIYTGSSELFVHYASPTARIKRSIVGEGGIIHGKITDSILFPGVTVEKGAVIEDSIVMSGCRIGKNSRIKKCVLCEDTAVEKHCALGDIHTAPAHNPHRIYGFPITVVTKDRVISVSIQKKKEPFNRQLRLKPCSKIIM